MCRDINLSTVLSCKYIPVVVSSAVVCCCTVAVVVASIEVFTVVGVCVVAVCAAINGCRKQITEIIDI